jgi:dihydroneopterin aldolase
MDVITLRGMRVMGRHGANPGERDAEQPFDLEIELHADLSVAQRSDNIEDTIDYDALYKRIAQIVRTTSFALLERLAGEILNAVFEDARVVRAHVTIQKPQLLDGATPSVRLQRDNPHYPARG